MTLHFPMITCERSPMRLSAASCARMWVSCRAKRPEPWEGRFKCLDCPTGAGHAGCVQAPPTMAERLKNVCPRCGLERDRIIGNHFCVSCYNRDREVLAGRNGKGSRPALTDRLHAVNLTIVENGVAKVVTFDRVTSRVEAVLCAAKRARGPIVIGLPPLHLTGVHPAQESRQ